MNPQSFLPNVINSSQRVYGEKCYVRIDSYMSGLSPRIDILIIVGAQPLDTNIPAGQSYRYHGTVEDFAVLIAKSIAKVKDE